jgi:hypothetical protein
MRARRAGERVGRVARPCIAAATVAVALTALSGCGSSDDGGAAGGGGGGASKGNSKESKGSTGGPSVAKVVAATHGVRTVRFQGQSTTKGNRFSWRLSVSGGLDREHRRAGILVFDTMRGTRASSEYRVIGGRAYLRQLTPRPGVWVRQNLRTQAPGGSLTSAIATGKVFGLRRLIDDPLKKVSEGSVRGEHVTQYTAQVRESSAGRTLNTTTPQEISIWLDSEDRVRRLRYGTGAPSSNPALGTIGERASIDFYALNEPVRVTRPRLAQPGP